MCCPDPRLFESGNDYERNEIKLNQEINQLKKQQKTQADKIYDLEKQLLKEKSKRGESEVENQELKSTINKQSEEMKSTRESNDQLQKDKIYVCASTPCLIFPRWTLSKLWWIVASWTWKKPSLLPQMI